MSQYIRTQSKYLLPNNDPLTGRNFILIFKPEEEVACIERSNFIIDLFISFTILFNFLYRVAISKSHELVATFTIVSEIAGPRC